MLTRIEPDLTPRQLASIAFRHRGKAALAFLTLALATVAVTVLTPKSYLSEGKLYVRLGRENVALDPTATLGSAAVIAVPQTRENEINSVVELLKSRQLLERVVDKVGPLAVLDKARKPAAEATPAEVDARTAEIAANEADLEEPSLLAEFNPLVSLTPREKAVNKLAKKLKVEAGKKSDVVLITYESRSPQVAQAVVASLIDIYLDAHISSNRTVGAYDFLRQQAEQLHVRLSAAEEDLRKLKNETGLAAPEVQRGLLVTRISRLQDQMLDAAATTSATQAEIAKLRDSKSKLSPTQVSSQTTGFGNEGADGMRKQLFDLEIKEQELQAKYTKDHPEVLHVRRQREEAAAIMSGEDRTRQQVTTAPNRAYEEVNAALLKQEPLLASLGAKAEALAMQLKTEQASLEQLNQNDVRVAESVREVALLDAQYRKAAENLQQAKIDRALQEERISNINVVQPASFNRKPVSPNLLLNAALGFILAMCASVAAIFAGETLSYPTADERETSRRRASANSEPYRNGATTGISEPRKPLSTEALVTT